MGALWLAFRRLICVRYEGVGHLASIQDSIEELGRGWLIGETHGAILVRRWALFQPYNADQSLYRLFLDLLYVWNDEIARKRLVAVLRNVFHGIIKVRIELNYPFSP